MFTLRDKHNETPRIAKAEIELALDQQRAFFAARRNPSAGGKLAVVSARASAFPRLRDWIFPAEVARDGGREWYDVLDVDFDPIPVWRQYSGKAYFLFGSEDDSTPTNVASSRIRALGKSRNLVTKTLAGTQHLGLEAQSICKAELGDVSRFHKDFFPTLRAWQRELN